MENKPIIQSSSIEEFIEMSEKLKTLPESVYSQIESVDKSVHLIDLTCFFKRTNGDTEIFLPQSIYQIKDTGKEYICVYYKDFLFKIPKENKINFKFV